MVILCVMLITHVRHKIYNRYTLKRGKMLKYKQLLLISGIFLNKTIIIASSYDSVIDYQALLSTIEFSPDIDTLSYLEDGHNSSAISITDSSSFAEISHKKDNKDNFEEPIANIGQEDNLEQPITNISIEES